MQEEIFRFSIVRNPQRIPAKKLETSIIHLIAEPNDKYSIYTAFLRKKSHGVPRENLITSAENELIGGSFLKDLSELKTNIAEYRALGQQYGI